MTAIHVLFWISFSAQLISVRPILFIRHLLHLHLHLHLHCHRLKVTAVEDLEEGFGGRGGRGGRGGEGSQGQKWENNVIVKF